MGVNVKFCMVRGEQSEREGRLYPTQQVPAASW
jgi:hypothetical protein